MCSKHPGTTIPPPCYWPGAMILSSEEEGGGGWIERGGHDSSLQLNGRLPCSGMGSKYYLFLEKLLCRRFLAYAPASSIIWTYALYLLHLCDGAELTLSTFLRTFCHLWSTHEAGGSTNISAHTFVGDTGERECIFRSIGLRHLWGAEG